MAGRNRIRHEAFDRQHVYQEVPVVCGHLVRQMPHPAILEEELDVQHAELQRLLDVNRTLVDDRIVMQQDLSASKEELHRLNVKLVETRTKREARSRNLLEKNTKMQADLLASEPLHMEAAQLEAEVQKLNKINKDLSGQIQNIMKDISKLQADNQQRPKLQADIDRFHQELLRSRSAIEYEKKEKSRLIEQRQTMEKNLTQMARDLEKLRADLVSSDAHSRTSGRPYETKYGGVDSSYPLPYGEAEAYGGPLGSADRGQLYSLGAGSVPSSWGGHENPQYARR